MVRAFKSFLSLIFAASVFSAAAHATDWPTLDSADLERPVHKTIISSILGRPGEAYHGGQYKTNFFVIQGNGVNRNKNLSLYQELPRLRRLLQEGARIQLYPVGTAEEVAQFSKNVLYQISVNGASLPFHFSLYNRKKLSNFEPFTIPRGNVAPAEAAINPPRQNFIEGVAPVRLGHGISSSTPAFHEKIDRLRAEHRNNPVLCKAFRIIEGADLAMAHDQKILLNTIRAHPNTPINKETLLNLMRRDRDSITRAANAFRNGNDPEDRYLPFLDQLHALGNQGSLLGHTYKGRKGIDGAIIFIRDHPELLDGILPQALKNLTGTDAIKLRIALFYVARAKAGERFGPGALTTFFKGNYFGTNPSVKDLLSQTSFFQNGHFYAPDNGYIKNADSANAIPNDFQGLDLGPNQGADFHNREMIFTDCSGFIQQVVRQCHPQNPRLQKRVMSYHLAPLYDVLANEKKGTRNGLYGLHGRKIRDLNDSEKSKTQQFSNTIEQLRSVYEPVLNPIANIRPGDILVERNANGGEGHVMFVVEQDSTNPSRVTIVELTGFGKKRGYAWRSLELSDRANGTFHRVLRIKS